MRAAEYSQWAQDEWAAFYLEFLGLPALVNTFGGGPIEYANTRFDYGLSHPWDLKVHMAGTPGGAPLNNYVAVDQVLASGKGVGFLVLSGDAVYDDGDFRAWQRESGVDTARSRAAHVTAQVQAQVEAPVLAAAAGSVLRSRRNQPGVRDAERRRQSDAAGCADLRCGAKPKYSLDLVKARFDGRCLLAQVVVYVDEQRALEAHVGALRGLEQLLDDEVPPTTKDQVGVAGDLLAVREHVLAEHVVGGADVHAVAHLLVGGGVLLRRPASPRIRRPTA